MSMFEDVKDDKWQKYERVDIEGQNKTYRMVTASFIDKYIEDEDIERLIQYLTVQANSMITTLKKLKEKRDRDEKYREDMQNAHTGEK